MIGCMLLKVKRLLQKPYHHKFLLLVIWISNSFLNTKVLYGENGSKNKTVKPITLENSTIPLPTLNTILLIL